MHYVQEYRTTTTTTARLPHTQLKPTQLYLQYQNQSYKAASSATLSCWAAAAARIQPAEQKDAGSASTYDCSAEPSFLPSPRRSIKDMLQAWEVDVQADMQKCSSTLRLTFASDAWNGVSTRG